MNDTPQDRQQESTAARIRARLIAAKRRFHSNDSIADFILPGELESLQAEVQSGLQKVLDALVIDTTSDHNTQDTAKREIGRAHV